MENFTSVGTFHPLASIEPDAIVFLIGGNAIAVWPASLIPIGRGRERNLKAEHWLVGAGRTLTLQLCGITESGAPISESA